jgi:hypothetical protein
LRLFNGSSAGTLNNPVANFDHLWGEYDRLYGAFEPKKHNWNASTKPTVRR